MDEKDREKIERINRDRKRAHRKLTQWGSKVYWAFLDLEKAGIENIIAIMTVFTDPKESENVANKLSEFEETIEVFTSLSEELLIIAKKVAGNQEQLHTFIANSVAPLPGVLRIRTSIVSKKFKDKISFIRKGVHIQNDLGAA